MPKPKASPYKRLSGRLTKSAIDRLVHPATFRDTVVRGLFVQTHSSGASFKIQADLWQGPRGSRRLIRTIRHTLGAVAELTVEEARGRATELLLSIKRGVDPFAQQKAQMQASWTVRDAVERYIADMQTRECAELTMEYTRARLTNHLSTWMDLPLADVKPSMCQAEHARITKESGKVAANKTLRDFRAVFNFARRKIDDPDTLRANPVESVTFHRERARQAVLHADDLPCWVSKARGLPNPLRALMHQLGLFSGLRPGNLVALRREWVDLKRQSITIPAEHMKARREFVLPLSRHMVDLVEQALSIGDLLFRGTPWLFPTYASNGRDVVHTRVWRERSLPNETGHILRHTWRTLAVSAGIVGTDAELLLAHAIPGVQGVYLHPEALFKHLLAQQERVTAHILSLLGEQTLRLAAE